MKVFLAGATGAIGRPLVKKLIEAGYEVTGMTRSAERAERLRAQGAAAVVCDALDAQALRDVVVDAGPEAVIHELTDIPPDLQRGASNAKAKRELGWSPVHSSWREGFVSGL